MGNCNSMKMGKGHRVGGEHQSGLRSMSGTKQPRQPHGGHGSKPKSNDYERGERQSKMRDKAD